MFIIEYFKMLLFPKYKERILNESLTKVKNMQSLKDKPADLPLLNKPPELQSHFLDTLETMPIVLIASILKNDKEAFGNEVTLFTRYADNFIAINAQNPFITIKQIGITQRQLEGWCRLLFLSYLVFKDKSFLTPYAVLKVEIANVFYGDDEGWNDNWMELLSNSLPK